MQRQIKFRAWDDEDNRMLGPESIYELGADDGGPSLGGKYLSFHDYPDGKIPLMQYTGLKDKNGVEIYEGDVLRNDTIKPQLVEIYATDDIIGAFGWGFKFRKLPNEPDMTWRMEMNQVEVIGNIYENPELLK
jgi:uncharacterized phage protein (TIGR01671 family)